MKQIERFEHVKKARDTGGKQRVTYFSKLRSMCLKYLSLHFSYARVGEKMVARTFI